MHSELPIKGLVVQIKGGSNQRFDGKKFLNNLRLFLINSNCSKTFYHQIICFVSLSYKINIINN